MNLDILFIAIGFLAMYHIVLLAVLHVKKKEKKRLEALRQKAFSAKMQKWQHYASMTRPPLATNY